MKVEEAKEEMIEVEAARVILEGEIRCVDRKWIESENEQNAKVNTKWKWIECESECECESTATACRLSSFSEWTNSFTDREQVNLVSAIRN